MTVRSGPVQGLLEAKKKRRDTDIEAIELQETAETVTWLKQAPEEQTFNGQ